MSNNECKTEETIKQLAKELFFSRGCFSASTQEIADFAGVNRTLVNYYFRSKNQLFELVYWEMIGGMRSELAMIYKNEIDFLSKIERIIDYLMDFRQTYPYLEVFNIQETVKLRYNKDSIVNPEFITELSIFLKEIEKEMEKGNILKSDPLNFIISLFSLVSYPIIMQPVFEKVFAVSSEEYQQLKEDRKQHILQLLFIKSN